MRELQFNYIYDNTLKAYNKIINTLDSCETEEQLESCKNMSFNLYNLILSYLNNMRSDIILNIFNIFKFKRLINRYKEYIRYNKYSQIVADDILEKLNSKYQYMHDMYEQLMREEMEEKLKPTVVKGFETPKVKKRRSKKSPSKT